MVTYIKPNDGSCFYERVYFKGSYHWLNTVPLEVVKAHCSKGDCEEDGRNYVFETSNIF